MASKTTHSLEATERQGHMAKDAERDAPEDDASGRRDRIAELAYFKAERRGFQPGYEVEDWLEAEAELSE